MTVNYLSLTGFANRAGIAPNTAEHIANKGDFQSQTSPSERVSAQLSDGHLKQSTIG